MKYPFDQFFIIREPKYNVRTNAVHFREAGPMKDETVNKQLHDFRFIGFPGIFAWQLPIIKWPRIVHVEQ